MEENLQFPPNACKYFAKKSASTTPRPNYLDVLWGLDGVLCRIPLGDGGGSIRIPNPYVDAD